MVPFYSLPKTERDKLVQKIHKQLHTDLDKGNTNFWLLYFNDADTYIRKTAYLAAGRIYFAHPELQIRLVAFLQQFFMHQSFYIRQTVVNAAGEIGMKDFSTGAPFMNKGLFDEHHSVRNAVIGSVKKMGQKNPVPVLAWAKQYLNHPDKEIRREICHGIELRGRTHPQDILPMLKTLEFDDTARVRNTLVHVLGQIAYKKGCLETVVSHLKTWKNTDIVEAALEEIIDVHERYRNFATRTQLEAKTYIENNF